MSIIINTGEIGQGKTLSATRDAIKRLDSDTIVFSNYKINWFGIYWLNPLQWANKYIKKWFLDYYIKKVEKQKKLFLEKKQLFYKYVELIEKGERPKFDVTKLYSKFYRLENDYLRLKGIKEKIEKGYFQDKWYDPRNVKYYDTLDTVFDFVDRLRLSGSKQPVLVVCDEAQNYFDSINFKKIPLKYRKYITQSRKKRLDW